jgi:hypothetical protein
MNQYQKELKKELINHAAEVEIDAVKDGIYETNKGIPFNEVLSNDEIDEVAKEIKNINENIIDFNSLNLFVKYCSNRIDIDKFIELMLKKHQSKHYIENLWNDFVKNPLMFITSRNETELFDNIQKEIIKLNYKG